MPLHAAGDLLVGEAVVDVAGHAPVQLRRVCLGPHHELLQEERMVPASLCSTCSQKVSLSQFSTETKQKLPLEIYVCFCEQ